MTKQTYLTQLVSKLKKHHADDATSTLSEYAERFVFKLADGFREDEIPAKPDYPSAQAFQFRATTGAEHVFASSIPDTSRASLQSKFAWLYAILLIGLRVILAAITLASTILAVCLFGEFNLYNLIPPIPYWCGAVFGLAFAALAVLTGIESFFHFVYTLRHAHSHGVFIRKRMIAAQIKMEAVRSDGSCSLDKADQYIRRTVYWAFNIFVVCFIAGMIASMLSTGACGFWHSWGWFGYLL